MRTEVCLPSLGDEQDAVQGGTVSAWLAKPGDLLDLGDDLLELNTDKAAFVVPCPAKGRLAERAVSEGDIITVGDTICFLDS